MYANRIIAGFVFLGFFFVAPVRSEIQPGASSLKLTKDDFSVFFDAIKSSGGPCREPSQNVTGRCLTVDNHSGGTLESEGGTGLKIDMDHDPSRFGELSGNHIWNPCSFDAAIFLQVDAVTIDHNDKTTAMIHPSGKESFGPQPFDSSCGRWDMLLFFAPENEQPLSRVSLHHDYIGSTQGEVTGTLTIEARVRFTHREDLRVVERAQTLELDLRGRWSEEPAADIGGPSHSNLNLNRVADIPDEVRCFEWRCEENGQVMACITCMELCNSCVDEKWCDRKDCAS